MQPGTRLGTYQIAAPIGGGGPGEAFPAIVIPFASTRPAADLLETWWGENSPPDGPDQPEETP